MCGIAGLFHWNGNPVVLDQIEGMCELIQHRGPDDQGCWVNGPIGLGHRRLSIIGLSSHGRNPLPNEDETVWLTANGEIYNYKELSRELTKQGHRFRSETDTEVILHLYEEGGPDSVKRLNGMFSFALWDERLQRLLLVRDRFGVKPLYYTLQGDQLAFASEVKAFLALPGFRPRLDLAAFGEHFTFQNTFGDRTFFKDVKLLPAGHYLLCEEGRILREQYWDLSFQTQSGLSLEDWAVGLRERLIAAVKRQLMSDVPLGTYLSGGMDTGSIAAIASQEIPGIHSFTCGFDLPRGMSDEERFFDERESSHRLSRLLGTIHHELKLGPEAMEQVLPSVVWHLDEPRVGISYQIFHTTEMISRFVTVVLSGVGGDELFAGYPWRYENILGLSGGVFDETYYRLWTRLLTDNDKRLLFTPAVLRALESFSSQESFRAVLSSTDETNPLHRALYFDFKTFLQGLLMVEDKLSMAHSVEARVPFLDNDLVDYVSRIPANFKLEGGQGKLVMREAMRDLLPEEGRTARKQGFTPPDETWFKRNETQRYLQSLILSSRALERGYFQPHYLKKILDDHFRGRRNHKFLIWSLLCFEYWNRLFVDGEVPLTCSTPTRTAT